MKHLWVGIILPLLAVSACGQAVPQDKPPVPSAQVAAMVDGLYKEVVASHPLGVPNRKIFGPYLSKGLLRRFDLEDACFDRWRRANPDPNLKPDVGLIEFGFFSGGVDYTKVQDFNVQKVEMEGDGSFRVLVKLTYSEGSFKPTWYVLAAVVLEDDRPVVDDIIYLKHDDRNEVRLSEILKQDCKGQ